MDSGPDEATLAKARDRAPALFTAALAEGTFAGATLSQPDLEWEMTEMAKIVSNQPTAVVQDCGLVESRLNKILD